VNWELLTGNLLFDPKVRLREGQVNPHYVLFYTVGSRQSENLDCRLETCLAGRRAADLFFHDFPNFHSLLPNQFHNINPAGQPADVNLCFGLGYLAGDELLTAEVQDG
jgi:hypothetical protein